MHKGFIYIIPLLLALIIFFVGTTVYFASKTVGPLPSSTPSVFEINSLSSPAPSILPTPTAKPASSPKLKTVLSKTPTPQPQAKLEDPCAKYGDRAVLTFIKVKVNPPGGSLEQNATITISPRGDCPAKLPTGYTNNVTYTMSPGTTTWTSPGFTSGDLRVNVDYKGNGYGADVDGTSGTREVNFDLR